MVKADAYGLGVAAVVAALTDSSSGAPPWGFGVAAVAEGEQLRQLGWSGRVIVFSPIAPGEFRRAADAALTICCSDVQSVQSWLREANRTGSSLAFHTEVDTGMGRAGFPWREVEVWGPRVAELAAAGVHWEGVFTHFHSADERNLDATDEQWSRFRDSVSRLPAAQPPRLVHTSNSAASLRRAGFGGDLARPGIYLYGGRVGADSLPRPVVALRTRLVLVRDVPAGSTVGYGATYRATRDERWGTLAIGYGDGLPRSLAGGGGEVIIRGVRAPIIGRISMDMTTIDLTGIPAARPGDVATIIGSDGASEIALDEVANRAGTISYEILTGLTRRLPRLYLDGDESVGFERH
jgi:alanine racemase